MSIAFTRSTVRTAFGFLAALGLVFSLFAIATPALADGDDSSEACKTDINVDAEDSGQSSDEITFTADAGSVVTGVCIKSGDDAFGADNKHSELITTDGVVGGGCYTIEGIGTDTVTVTKSDSSDCKGLSHVDVVTGPGESPEESVEARSRSRSRLRLRSRSRLPSRSRSRLPSRSRSRLPSRSRSRLRSRSRSRLPSRSRSRPPSRSPPRLLLRSPRARVSSAERQARAPAPCRTRPLARPASRPGPSRSCSSCRWVACSTCG